MSAHAKCHPSAAYRWMSCTAVMLRMRNTFHRQAVHSSLMLKFIYHRILLHRHVAMLFGQLLHLFVFQ